MGYWSTILVKQGTPGPCTPEQLATSRSGTTKTGYSFERQLECEWHSYVPSDECPTCYETVTYTDADLKESAVDSAKRSCDTYYDSWCVDSDTLEIVAAFRLTRERLI